MVLLFLPAFSAIFLRTAQAGSSIYFMSGTTSLWFISLFILNSLEVPCDFDAANLAYRGSESEQARCLLRPVKKYGRVENKKLSKLPKTLAQLMGKKPEFSERQLRTYLKKNKIKEAEIGGAITGPISRVKGQAAKYFVIQDTGSPEINCYSNNVEFFNNLNLYTKRAHVFINRYGQSKTIRDFKKPAGPTKFEKRHKYKGLFIHAILLQPRHRDLISNSSQKLCQLSPNLKDPPSVAFKQKQYNRLAITYIVASFRAKKWLIPAYYTIIDYSAGYADSPQGFSLNTWDNNIAKIRKSIFASTQAPAPKPALKAPPPVKKPTS